MFNYFFTFFLKELDEVKAYPVEVIPGLLYMGNHQQASAPHVYYDLKIKGTVVCTLDVGTSKTLETQDESFMHLPMTDDTGKSIYFSLFYSVTYKLKFSLSSQA